MFDAITREFAEGASRIQEVVSSDPEAYLRVDRYVSESHFLAPRLYLYSDDPSTSLFPEPLDLDAHLLAAQDAFDLPSGTRYAYRLFPAKVPEGTRHFGDMWEHFVQVAGTMALFEETDWNHPLRTWFLRKMPDQDVRFIRRM